MFKDLTEPTLQLESIWEDEGLLEVRIRASNGAFSGRADCYTDRPDIENFAALIERFPKHPGQELNFTTGESKTSSYFNFSLREQDRLGHLVARVKIAHIATYGNAPKESAVSEFDIFVEPVAIDSFFRSLIRLARDGIGEAKAELRGKT